MRVAKRNHLIVDMDRGCATWGDLDALAAREVKLGSVEVLLATREARRHRQAPQQEKKQGAPSRRQVGRHARSQGETWPQCTYRATWVGTHATHKNSVEVAAGQWYTGFMCV